MLMYEFIQSSCYLCHEEGHKINKCPLGHKKDGFRVCYRCGSTEHTIKVCKKRNTGNVESIIGGNH